MTFSFSLFLALLLLFPGFSFWAGVRIGERSDFTSPSPEKPNSTAVLFTIILGALFGHVIMASLIYMMQSGCSATSLCFRSSFDPNIYRVLVGGYSGMREAPDSAFVAWFLTLLTTGGGTFLCGELFNKYHIYSKKLDPALFGWLTPIVQSVRDDNAFVIAYVVTKTAHDGISVGYEGVVAKLALDDDQGIKLIVLNNADRFLVRLTKRGLHRVDFDSRTIDKIQIASGEIANIALEVIEAPVISDDLIAAENAEQYSDDDHENANETSEVKKSFRWFGWVIDFFARLKS